MKANAALYYLREGYDTSGERLMGRHAAGEAFLQGYVRHSGVNDIYCYTNDKTSFKDFTGRVKPHIRGTKNIHYIPFSAHDVLETIGCLFYPSPGIPYLSWQRRHVKQNAYSLCGVTHTIVGQSVVDKICDILLAPVEPWDALICTSQAVKTSLSRLLGDWAEYLEMRCGKRLNVPIQMPVIPLGVNTESFSDKGTAEFYRNKYRRLLQIPADDVAVLFVGRLSYLSKANPLAMYTSLEMAGKTTKRRIHLILSGWFDTDKTRDEFIQTAHVYAPGIKVHIIDGRRPEVRTGIWYAADIFSSLSDNIQETFGLTLIEAMAAGLPVVATDWNGYKDTVRNGTDGFLIPTCSPEGGNAADIALMYEKKTISYDDFVGASSQYVSIDHFAATNAYVRLIENPELRNQMGESGRRRSEEVFDWKVLIKRYQDLWAELNEIRTHGSSRLERRGGTPSNPRRPDPFHLFSCYPSRQMTDNIKIRRGSQSDLDEFLKTSMVNFARGTLLNENDMAAILRTLETSGSRQLRDLRDCVSDKRPQVLRRSLGWMAKVGLIHFEK